MNRNDGFIALSINICTLSIPILMEDNKESCSDGGDHDEDLGHVQGPAPVGDVVQGDVGERGQLRPPELVSDGQRHGGQQEVAEDEAQGREGLPVLLGELCADDSLRRHTDLNLDGGSIPFEIKINNVYPFTGNQHVT